MIGSRLAARPRPNALHGPPANPDELVRRLASRDDGAFEAFEVLYDAYHRTVLGIGLRLLGDAASAEDVTQAVFLKLWTNPSSFRGGSLAAWIGRVARNAGLDILRQRSTRRRAEIAADVPVDAALEDTVLAHLDALHVRSALRRLPETERLLIEMGFFSGMTHHGVATETGLPLGTVKTRIRTGLHRLRDTLELQSHEAC